MGMPPGGGGRRPAAVAAAGALVITTFVGRPTDASPDGVTAAHPAQSGFAELAVGEWFGNGRAVGPTSRSGVDASIQGSGDFTVNFELAVDIDASVNGSWDLFGRTTWGFNFPGSEFVAEMSHTATGAIDGNSQVFRMGQANIQSEWRALDTSGVPLQSGSSTDPIGPIELHVGGIRCNDAWGTWIASWNLELSQQQYTPTFNGDWAAIRQSSEFSDRENELIATISEWANSFAEQTAELITPDVLSSDVGYVVPADDLWATIYRGVSLYNALRNLSDCDRLVVGEADVERWTTMATMLVGTLANSLLLQYDLDVDSVRELISMSATVGAFGEGAEWPGASTLERRIDEELVRIINDSEADASDRLEAAAIRWQYGWTID